MFKRSLFVLVLFILTIFVQTSFADFGWWDSTGDHLWENPENWNKKVVPTLSIDDGDVILNDKAIYPGVGVFINSDVNVVANLMQLSTTADGTATLNVAGGILTAYGQMRLGVNVSGTGIVNLSSGLIDNTGSAILVGQRGSGILNITGGTFSTDGLTVCQNDGATGHVQLDGGVISTHVLALNYNKGDATFDITGGTLIVDLNKIATIQEWFDLGYFTAYGGIGVLDMSYDSIENETTVTAYIPPDLEYSKNPYPRDEVDQHVPVSANLHWSPGHNALNHMVYIGTNIQDVNEADMNSVEFKVSLAVDSNTYDPTLEYNTTYYWRVDESDGNDIYKGQVWTFKTRQSFAADEEMLKWMDCMLAEDMYVAEHAEEYNSVDACWQPITATYQPFKTRVNKLWNQVYWRKNKLGDDFSGELLSYDNDEGVIYLHTEIFGAPTKCDPPDAVWDVRIDRVRLFVKDGTNDWGRGGRSIAPVDADINWYICGNKRDIFLCNSFDELNNQIPTCQLADDIEEYAFIERYGPFNNVFDGECAGWSADNEFKEFDEVIICSNYRRHSETTDACERLFFARKGDIYYGLVRWDAGLREIGGELKLTHRAVGLKISQSEGFSFDGFYERSRRDKWIAFYGDSNHNSIIEMSDIKDFAINWQSQAKNLGWDINGDNKVDFNDFAAVAAFFSK